MESSSFGNKPGLVILGLIGLVVSATAAQKSAAHAQAPAVAPPQGAAVAPVAQQAPVPDRKTLVIDKIEQHLTPRTDTWCMYAEFTAGTPESEDDYKNKTNGPVPSVVQPNLRLDGVAVGDVCQFKVILDKDFDQVGANGENRAKGSFKATRRGKKNFRYTMKGPGNYYNVADDNAIDVSWHLTIYWHLE